jgi:hypothetical protein
MLQPGRGDVLIGHRRHRLLEEFVGLLTGSAKLSFRLPCAGACDPAAVYIAPRAARVNLYNRSIYRDIRTELRICKRRGSVRVSGRDRRLLASRKHSG